MAWGIATSPPGLDVVGSAAPPLLLSTPSVGVDTVVVVVDFPLLRDRLLECLRLDSLFFVGVDDDDGVGTASLDVAVVVDSVFGASTGADAVVVGVAVDFPLFRDRLLDCLRLESAFFVGVFNDDGVGTASLVVVADSSFTTAALV